MSINIKINCVDNDRGPWCKNTDVKRSLFGIGARCCSQFPSDTKEGCPYRVKLKKPTNPPTRR